LPAAGLGFAAPQIFPQGRGFQSGAARRTQGGGLLGFGLGGFRFGRHGVLKPGAAGCVKGRIAC
jgi:hypothetical protein